MRTCPTHSKELRQGNNGSWYCATNEGTREAPNWCKYKEYDNQPQQVKTSDIVIDKLDAILSGVRNLEVKMQQLQDGLTSE